MKNAFEVRGDVTAININGRGQVLETLIDTADLARLETYPFTWYAMWHRSTHQFRVAGAILTSSGKRSVGYLHTYLLNPSPGLCVDHINRNALDNRRSANLRLVTNAQNHQNTAAQRNGRTGVRGVSWYPKLGKYRAHVTVNRKMRHLGYFDRIEDAAVAASRARADLMPYSEDARIMAPEIGKVSA